MTIGDQAGLVKALNSRGYLVVEANRSQNIKVGDVILDSSCDGDPIGIPVRIVRETTIDDFRQHREACGWPDDWWPKPWNQYFVVEMD